MKGEFLTGFGRVIDLLPTTIKTRRNSLRLLHFIFMLAAMTTIFKRCNSEKRQTSILWPKFIKQYTSAGWVHLLISALRSSFRFHEKFQWNFKKFQKHEKLPLSRIIEILQGNCMKFHLEFQIHIFHENVYHNLSRASSSCGLQPCRSGGKSRPNPLAVIRLISLKIQKPQILRLIIESLLSKLWVQPRSSRHSKLTKNFPASISSSRTKEMRGARGGRRVPRGGTMEKWRWMGQNGFMYQ